MVSVIESIASGGGFRALRPTALGITLVFGVRGSGSMISHRGREYVGARKRRKTMHKHTHTHKHTPTYTNWKYVRLRICFAEGAFEVFFVFPERGSRGISGRTGLGRVISAFGLAWRSGVPEYKNPTGTLTDWWQRDQVGLALWPPFVSLPLYSALPIRMFRRGESRRRAPSEQDGRRSVSDKVRRPHAHETTFATSRSTGGLTAALDQQSTSSTSIANRAALMDETANTTCV